jgi:nitric oxide reductase large subunit
MQVVRQKEIDGLAQGHEYGSGWGYQSFLTKDWKGKARHANVEYRASTLVNLALSSADELSAAMAKAWGGTAEKMREMFNRAGGAASFLF